VLLFKWLREVGLRGNIPKILLYFKRLASLISGLFLKNVQKKSGPNGPPL
jgi:hypothetical protein